MIYFYLLTLLIPLVLSFVFDDTDVDHEFFTLFSLNKVLIFINGMILAHLGGMNPFVGLIVGGLQVAFYIFAFRAMRHLEFQTHAPVVEEGSEGMCYTTIEPYKDNVLSMYNLGKIMIQGNLYTAISEHKIESFTPIRVVKVLNTNLYLVEPRF